MVVVPVSHYVCRLGHIQPHARLQSGVLAALQTPPVHPQQPRMRCVDVRWGRCVYEWIAQDGRDLQRAEARVMIVTVARLMMRDGWIMVAATGSSCIYIEVHEYESIHECCVAPVQVL